VVKALLRKVRRFMQAEVMDELARLRAELAQANALARQMEAALLSLALIKERERD
jgi:outer membrane protein TolC